MKSLFRLQPSGRIRAGHLIDYGYKPGDNSNDEQVIQIPPDRRSAVLSSLPGDQYYSINIQAVRTVDADISPSGVVKSPYTPLLITPYRPTSTVTFGGNVTGEVNGISASTLTNSISRLLPPSGDGLYMSQTYMGYYKSGLWETYIDNSGNFQLGDGVTGPGLAWNQALGTLDIRGKINVSDITTGSLTANRQINVGGMVIDSVDGTTNTGNIHLGQSAFNTGAGLWLGKVAGKTKFSLGDPAGNYLTWDENTGTLNIKGPLNADDISAGTLNASRIGTGTLAASQQITVGGVTIDSGSGSTNGNIRLGQSSYNTGTGFWLGQVAGVPKFSIGNATKYITWDGTSLAIRGTLNASDMSSGSIDASVISVTNLDAANIKTSSLAANKQITVGGITIDSGSSSTNGNIRLGKATPIDETAGFWLGNDAGVPKFSIGDDESSMIWDGDKLSLLGDIGGTGSHKWLLKRYNNCIPKNNSPYLAYLTGKSPDKVIEISDSYSGVVFSQTAFPNQLANQVLVAHTNIYCPPGTPDDSFIYWKISCSSNVYWHVEVNGPSPLINGNPGSYDGGPGPLTNSNRMLGDLNFGWNTIDVLIWDPTGTETFTINSPGFLGQLLIGGACNVTNMNAYSIDAASRSRVELLEGQSISHSGGGKRQTILTAQTDETGKETFGTFGSTISNIGGGPRTQCNATFTLKSTLTYPLSCTYAAGFDENGPVDYYGKRQNFNTVTVNGNYHRDNYVYMELTNPNTNEVNFGNTFYKPIYSEIMQDACSMLPYSNLYDFGEETFYPYNFTLYNSYGSSPWYDTMGGAQVNPPVNLVDASTVNYYQSVKTLAQMQSSNEGLAVYFPTNTIVRKIRIRNYTTVDCNPASYFFYYGNNGQSWSACTGYSASYTPAIVDQVGGEWITLTVPDYPASRWLRIVPGTVTGLGAQKWTAFEMQFYVVRQDQHWFDLKNYKMKYFDSASNGWINTNRVFIGENSWRIRVSGGNIAATTNTVAGTTGQYTITVASNAGFVATPGVAAGTTDQPLMVGIQGPVPNYWWFTYITAINSNVFTLADPLPGNMTYTGLAVRQFEPYSQKLYTIQSRWTSGIFKVRQNTTYPFQHGIGTDRIIVEKMERQDSTYMWAKNMFTYNAAYHGGSINIDPNIVNLYYKDYIGKADTHGAGSFGASAVINGEAQLFIERAF